MPKKATKPPKPTAAELDLLRVIWRLGASTVKDVHHARLSRRADVAEARTRGAAGHAGYSQPSRSRKFPRHWAWPLR